MKTTTSITRLEKLLKKSECAHEALNLSKDDNEAKNDIYVRIIGALPSSINSIKSVGERINILNNDLNMMMEANVIAPEIKKEIEFCRCALKLRGETITTLIENETGATFTGARYE